jgi:hypothetical protein
METLQVVSKDSDGVWRVNTLTVAEVQAGVLAGTVLEDSLIMNGHFPSLYSLANFQNLQGKGR